MYLTDWSNRNPWGTRTTMVLGSGAYVQPKDTLKEIWGGDAPVPKACSRSGWSTAPTAYTNATVWSATFQHASRVLLRQGIDASLDELVRVAMTERSRPRQQFGTGPVVLEDLSARIAELRLRKRTRKWP